MVVTATENQKGYVGLNSLNQHCSSARVGGLILLIGAVLLYVGIKTPEGEKVDWGLGTYYDRTGICFRAILVLFIGAVALTVRFFYQA